MLGNGEVLPRCMMGRMGGCRGALWEGVGLGGGAVGPGGGGGAP